MSCRACDVGSSSERILAIAFRVGNSVLLHRDLAKALHEKRGIKPISLFESLERCLRDRRGMLFFYEPKVLGLIQASEEVKGSRELAERLRTYIWHTMETATRFRLFRFIYAQTRDKIVLEDALKFKSAKIRKWAENEMKLRMRSV